MWWWYMYPCGHVYEWLNCPVQFTKMYIYYFDLFLKVFVSWVQANFWGIHESSKVTGTCYSFIKLQINMGVHCGTNHWCCCRCLGIQFDKAPPKNMSAYLRLAVSWITSISDIYNANTLIVQMGSRMGPSIISSM